ncbi:MAG TPA: serine/threonine-protein kinase [Bryobacteraceae bacterium]|nr:serine/threonine-protein kinase [Bryobacteraceae bacterium]
MNPGDRFLHFAIISFIGRGNFGDVYVAQNLRDNRRIALKIVRKGVGEDEEAKYRAEIYGAKLQKELHDPEDRVVKVFDFGADEQTSIFFIEMEYIEGDDLSTLMRVRRDAVPAPEIARIGADLCGLLDWLSAAKVVIDGNPVSSIVHGDMKPRNVRIDARSGRLKVIDFGIARALKETNVTMPFNSPAYTSPERLETGRADLQSDLWAVGVMLYELAARRLPFEAENREQLERRIRNPEPPPPLPEAYPEPLRRAILRMLRRDPAQRFSNPAEARRAFDNLLTGAVGPDETVRSTNYAPADSDPTVRATPTRAQAAPPARRKQPALVRLMIFGAFGFVIVTILGNAYATYRSASVLAASLDTEQLKNTEEAWTRYQELNGKTWWTGMLYPARRALKKQLVGSANQYIDEYRSSDTPLVFEKQWRLAANYLSKALELDSTDKDTKASLRLCEGHLARIQSSSTAARKELSLRQKYTNTAVQKFEEAVALRPRWPDPYLGLARLYTYELTDMDRAVETLERARQLGHRTGKREKAQLADGYRRLVERHWEQSRKMRDIPEQEKQLLSKARSYCEYSSSLYQEVGVYQSSVDFHKILVMRCKEIDRRLTEMPQ